MSHMIDESEDPGVRVLCSEALGDAVKHGVPFHPQSKVLPSIT